MEAAEDGSLWKGILTRPAIRKGLDAPPLKLEGDTESSCGWRRGPRSLPELGASRHDLATAAASDKDAAWSKCWKRLPSGEQSNTRNEPSRGILNENPHRSQLRMAELKPPESFSRPRFTSGFFERLTKSSQSKALPASSGAMRLTGQNDCGKASRRGAIVGKRGLTERGSGRSGSGPFSAPRRRTSLTLLATEPPIKALMPA